MVDLVSETIHQWARLRDIITDELNMEELSQTVSLAILPPRAMVDGFILSIRLTIGQKTFLVSAKLLDSGSFRDPIGEILTKLGKGIASAILKLSNTQWW